MKSVIVVLFLFVISYCGFGQETIQLSLIEREPSFLSVIEVHVGPPIFYNNVLDEKNAGFKHRLIVSLSGIYTTVYVDKIMVDIEGDTNKQDWCYKIEMGQLYSKFTLSQETDHLEFLRWVDTDSFVFEIDNLMFEARIADDDRILEVLLLK